MSEKLKSVIERRHKTTFWARNYFITPRLVDRVYGDGKVLLAICPLNTRPNYYVVRVDSSWSYVPEHSMFGYPEPDDDKVREGIDEILWDIEDQFGRAWYEDDPPQRKRGRKFPALNDDVGISWGLIRDKTLIELNLKEAV